MIYEKFIQLRAFDDFYLLLINYINKTKNENIIVENETKTIDEIQNALIKNIQEHDIKIAKEEGPLASTAFQEVIYAMVALADELFLSFNWYGKNFWRDNLLEQKLFNTRCSGDKIFANLYAFLNNNIKSKEIAIVYLKTLSLGFVGKMKYIDNYNQEITNIKENLYYIAFDESNKLYSRQTILFKQTEENILFDVSKVRKQSFYNMRNILIFCGIAYLITTSIIWLIQTHEIHQLIKIHKETK